MRCKTPDSRPVSRSKKWVSQKADVVSPPRRYIRVFVAESHEIFNAGFKAVISGERDLEVVGDTHSTDELISEARRSRPDVVVLESRMAGESDAETCQKLFAVLPSIRIIIVGSDDGADAFHNALEIGVQGFLGKNSGRSEVIQAIRTVVKGVPYLCPGATTATFHLLRRQQNGDGLRSGLQILSPQERRVIALIAEGYTNKEIAAKLVLSDKTVKNYIVSIYTKLQIERRTQAVALYLKTQLHPPQLGQTIST